MSIANPSSGPRAAQPTATPLPSSVTAQIPAKIDLLISLTLHSWPALTLAIQNNWGGPASTDKRDWFCGAISDLLSTNQIADADDLEEVLVQVMLDEFEVVVDDETPAEVAGRIMKGREKVMKGEFGEVDGLWEAWREKQAKGGQEKVLFKRGEDMEEEDTDWDEDDDDDDGDEDEEMGEAPQLVEKPKKEKVEPEVDEEGFTKVAGRKR